jgi:hypothetical protein
MLTAIILRSGAENQRWREECVKSLGKLPVAVVYADHGPAFSQFEITTDYVLYIYDNERITPELYEAIPVFFHCDMFDYLKFYRRSSKRGDIIPRIFRNHVVLKDDSLYPVDIDMYVGETVLNGWLEEIE